MCARAPASTTTFACHFEIVLCRYAGIAVYDRHPWMQWWGSGKQVTAVCPWCNWAFCRCCSLLKAHSRASDCSKLVKLVTARLAASCPIRHKLRSQSLSSSALSKHLPAQYALPTTLISLHMAHDQSMSCSLTCNNMQDFRGMKDSKAGKWDPNNA